MTRDDAPITPSKINVDDAMAQIEMLELPYLEVLAKRLTKHIEERRMRDYADAKAEIIRIAARVGMTIDELITAAQPKSKSSLPPRYRHPDGRTWSGQGRMPLWIKDEANREQYRI